LMANAGFEPAESVALWQNMGRGGSAPPELLSTHPSHRTRIQDLSVRVPEAEALRDRAREQGRVPRCERPAGPGQASSRPAGPFRG